MIPLRSLVLALGLAQGLLCTALEPLRFTSDGLFKIALFTDLHYGESSELDLQSDEVQRTVLAQEQPDFILFGGDMVSGWKGKGKDGWFQNRWRQLTRPAREFSTPYAIILGNHDDEGNLDRRKILQYDIDTSDGLSWTQQGPLWVGGASNYFIDIFSSSSMSPSPQTLVAASSASSLQPIAETTRNVSEFSTKAQVLPPSSTSQAARLWFFDSMNRGCLNQRDSWGCVAPTAIEWASSLSKTLPLVPTSMAFVHIPIPEAINVWEQSTEPVFGSKREMSNCQGVNTGLHKFAQENAIQAVWSGHDHVNDFVGVWEGVKIGYGRKSGYGSYFYGNTIVKINNTSSASGGGGARGSGSNSEVLVPVQRGARIIELRQGESAIYAKTWIALESGEREYQREVNRLMSGGPPEQIVCRSGAEAVGGRKFNKSKNGVLWWWCFLLYILGFAVLFT